MGLAVAVGRLSDLVEHDEEEAEWLREAFASCNELLVANNLPVHNEPQTPLPEASRCAIDGYPYSFLHYLRRVYAHVVQDPSWKLQPVQAGDNPAEDPVAEEVAAQLDSHLLCHSDAEGYYLPIDFSDVLFDEAVPGMMLGSSYQLMRELTAIASNMEIKLNNGQLDDSEAERLNDEVENEGPFWIEKCVWLSLFEATRLSLKYKAAVCFT